MRKFLSIMAAAATMMACSVDSPETNGDFNSFDAKANAQAEEELFTVPEQICAGEEAEFCATFPQKFKGNGDLQTTNVQVQLYDAVKDEWIQIDKGDANTEHCFSFVFSEANDYQLRYSIGGGGFTKVSVMVENCGCEESFNYEQNIDGSYTFIYIPAEDMDDAEVIFTFAQSVEVSGFDGNWEENGQTRKAELDLEACTSYVWQLSLEKKCDGSTPNNNVWTDFKVNDISKKGDLGNITQECSE